MATIDDNTVVCLALKECSHVGPKLFQQLLMTFGHPDNLFDKHSEEIASMVGINLDQAQDIIDAYKSFDDARDTIDRLGTLGISVIGFFDDAYPESLRKIADPPLAIYVKGDETLLGGGGVALVGSTAADQAGIKASVDFVREFLKYNQTIVSGLAVGIDSAAHLSCLKNNGKTIAVLGCGHLNIYPEENIPLARLIAESGAVVSEFEAYADPIPGRLVSRNRIIAALADIVILVQIGDRKKGELYTAHAAIDQGKPVAVYDPKDEYDLETLLNNPVIKIKELGEIDELLKYIIK